MLLVLFLVFLVTAAPAPSATAIGLTLAGIVAVFSPLALKYVKLDGASMTALTYAVALACAILAEYIAGDLTFSRDGLLAVLTGSGSVWTVQQLVYAALKARVPGLVTTPPPAFPAPKPTTT